MSEAAVVEAPAAATSPATAAAAATAAPASAAAPAVMESLIHPDATAATASAAQQPAASAATPAAEDQFAALLGRVPEKFHVKAGDNKLDPAASLAKALEHRDHLEKRLGAGDIPPKTAAEYGFKMPDGMQDLELNGDKLNAFKEGAHKMGFTQQQFEWAMNMHVNSVPDLMEGAARLTAAQARAELQKTWASPADYDSGISNATRALRGLPADLIEATREFGTNPAFLRAMAHFGAQMREDRPPAGAGAPAPAGDVRSLMASEAYTNPKHPQHQDVSKQVAAYYARAHGTTPL